MIDSPSIWRLKHQEKLEILLCEGKSCREIETIFRKVFSENFKYSTICERARRTRLKLRLETKKDVSAEWRLEDLEKLAALMQKGARLRNLELEFKDRYTIDAIRDKAKILRPSIKVDPLYKRVSKKWEPKENDILVELYSKGLSYAEIVQFLPGRTIEALESRINYLGSEKVIQIRVNETIYTPEENAHFQELFK